jgi:NTP pyrophosphatase (non-canonical NTP hydrolase)
VSQEVDYIELAELRDEANSLRGEVDRLEEVASSYLARREYDQGLIDAQERELADIKVELAAEFEERERLEAEGTVLRADILAYNSALAEAHQHIEDLECASDDDAFDVYQEFAATTARYPNETLEEAVTYLALGLASEAGEVASKVKKMHRDHAGVLDDDQQRAIADELGDVTWYVARLADELGYYLSEVASRNKTKLTSRLERGVIGGSGDQR